MKLRMTQHARICKKSCHSFFPSDLPCFISTSKNFSTSNADILSKVVQSPNHHIYHRIKKSFTLEIKSCLPLNYTSKNNPHSCTIFSTSADTQLELTRLDTTRLDSTRLDSTRLDSTQTQDLKMIRGVFYHRTTTKWM